MLKLNRMPPSTQPLQDITIDESDINSRIVFWPVGTVIPGHPAKIRCAEFVGDHRHGAVYDLKRDELYTFIDALRELAGLDR